MIEKKTIIDNIENEFEIKDKEINIFLLTLLEKFEIFITHPKKDNLLIIPFLMDSKKPIEIENEWNTIDRNTKESLKQIRYYIFNFLPSGIMSKIIYGFHNPNLKNIISILNFGEMEF